MTPDAKLAAMKAIFDKALKLAADKGHDYSGTEDGMANFRKFGWKGIVVRLSDKMERICHFAKSGVHKVKSESVENDLTDIINYAALTLIMYREENGMDRPAQPKGFESPIGPCAASVKVGGMTGTTSNAEADKSDTFRYMLEGIRLMREKGVPLAPSPPPMFNVVKNAYIPDGYILIKVRP